MPSNLCTTCGGELLTSSGQTFCPACLLQQGMKSSTYGGGSKPAWQPPKMEQLAASFPHLEIQQLLGIGGMGAVFRVRQKELDRVAALKVLPGEMATTPGFPERFLREARLLASLSHPHIVTVYEFGQRDGIYFLLMEFVDGVTLRQALRAEPIKKLDSKEALAIVGQLCDALQFAHDEGVVHRDIKPENILIDKRGRVKIADFGLARLLGQSPTMPTLTGTHQLMGTPAYMAPEQIEGLPGIDHRADIYSMGVVFYELLTGELPLGRFSLPSERAETDVRLDEVVLRTLAKEPARRYQQASHVKTDVDALRSPPVAVNPFALTTRRRWIGKVAVGFVLGVLATCALAVLLVNMTLSHFSERSVDVAIADARAAGKAEAMASLQAARDEALRQQTLAGNAAVAMGDMMSSEPLSDGGMGEAMSSDSFRDPYVVNNSSVLLTGFGWRLHPGLFNLPSDHMAKVNDILNETHERYLKEEALHSLVSVDAAGVQTTEIKPFPDQLRLIENEFWTQLDDAVPVETQKQFRDRLILFSTSSNSAGMGAGYPGSGGIPGGGSGYPGGAGGYPGGGTGYGGIPGMAASDVTDDPGLLGWSQEALPITIKIGRKGRWFVWNLTRQLEKQGPDLPSHLRRFFREPGPWMPVANVKAAIASKDWMKLPQNFTASAQLRVFLAAQLMHEAMGRRWNGDAGDAAGMEYTSKVSEVIGKSPELSELMAELMNTAEAGANASEWVELTKTLTHCPPSEVDAHIASAVQRMPERLLNYLIASHVLAATVIGGDELEFDLANGAVGEYQQADDTATAVLSVPNKSPILIRFVREQGQWKIDAIGSNEDLQKQLQQAEEQQATNSLQAVLTGAVADYKSKAWMKLADHFTPAAHQQLFYMSLPLLESVGSRLTEQGEAGTKILRTLPEKYLREIARVPELSAVFGQHLGTGLAEPLHWDWDSGIAELSKLTRDQMSQLIDLSGQKLSADQEASLRNQFAVLAISTSVLPDVESQLRLDALKLEQCAISGDNATAMLRLEGMPPMPVRFVRQNGEWKIDAIGSPEQVLERLQQTEIWQQASALNTVIDTANAARNAKDWQTLADCFTQAGKYRWALRTNALASAERTSVEQLPTVKDGEEAVTGAATEVGRWMLQHAAAKSGDDQPVDDKPLPDGKVWRVLFDEYLTCDPARSDQILIQLSELGPESLLDAMFAGAAIHSSMLPPDSYHFELSDSQLSAIKVTGDKAVGELISTGGGQTIPIRFERHNGIWKIDAIGTAEELQQQARTAQERQDGASPRDVVEAFRKAMEDGRFSVALKCMTEDARNEWLGEMLIGCLQYDGGYFENAAKRFLVIETTGIYQATGDTLRILVNRWKDETQISDRTLTPDQRRQFSIEVAQSVGVIKDTDVKGELLQTFLKTRFQMRPELYPEPAFGEFEELPDRDGPKGARKYRLNLASSDAPLMSLNVVQVDGLWKLDTIIDPALKPWPLAHPNASEAVDTISTPEP